MIAEDTEETHFTLLGIQATFFDAARSFSGVSCVGKVTAKPSEIDTFPSRREKVRIALRL